MVLADGTGTPLGVHLEAASPAEVTLVEATLARVKVRTGKRKRGKPQRLIGDRGYDSNTVRTLLMKRGIEPIIPACRNNHVATHQDGRKMRRYKRRGLSRGATAGFRTSVDSWCGLRGLRSALLLWFIWLVLSSP
jgi:hypothetical protein